MPLLIPTVCGPSWPAEALQAAQDDCCSGQQLLNKMELKNSTPTSHKQDWYIIYILWDEKKIMHLAAGQLCYRYVYILAEYFNCLTTINPLCMPQQSTRVQPRGHNARIRKMMIFFSIEPSLHLPPTHASKRSGTSTELGEIWYFSQGHFSSVGDCRRGMKQVSLLTL